VGIKTLLPNCGNVVAVHFHSRGRKLRIASPTCRRCVRECASWRDLDALPPKRRTRAGVTKHEANN